MGWIYRIIIFGFLCGLVGLGFVAWMYKVYSKDLPDHRGLANYDPARVSRLFTEDGQLMIDYARQRRVFMPIENIPKQVQLSFLAIEDSNYYKHPGIDVFGIARAFYNNLVNDKHEGASTITQQVVKNILLSNEKTWKRKIREAILAYRLSVSFSKDRILEIYLNEIYLGGGAYGVGAAAQTYFNKTLEELSLEDSAMLAALPKAPSHYNPARNPKAALIRRNQVLERMALEGFASREEVEAAKKRPIMLSKKKVEVETAKGDYFSEEVRRQLITAFGEQKLYEKGMMVHTTMEPKLQLLAEKALRNSLDAYTMRHGYKKPIDHIATAGWEAALKKYTMPVQGKDWEIAIILGSEAGKEGHYKIGLQSGKTNFIAWEPLAKEMQSGIDRAKNLLKTGDVVYVQARGDKKDPYRLRQVPGINGAVVVMDPHTGRVHALVGGYAFGDSQFNRATQAARQPGSTFKPFVYLAALEAGYSPADLIADEKLEIPMGRSSNGSKQFWAPQNYSGNYYGPTSLRAGVEQSINVVTVHLAMSMGIDKVNALSKKLGIGDNRQNDLSVVLGSQETTLLNMTTAYGIVANGGKKINPHLVERVHDHTGKMVFKHEPFACDGCIVEESESLKDAGLPVITEPQEQLIDAASNYQITSILRGVVERGTGRAAAKLNAMVAGKTGTTNDSRDAWFIGFTPDIVIGVYTGFDQPRSLGNHEYGATIALPVFMEIMEAITPKEGEPKKFQVPSSIQQVQIDRKTGYLPSPQTPASDILWEGFKVGTAPTYSLPRTSQVPVISSGGVKFSYLQGHRPAVQEGMVPASQQGTYKAWTPPDSVPVEGGQPPVMQPYPQQPIQQVPQQVYQPQGYAPQAAPVPPIPAGPYPTEPMAVPPIPATPYQPAPVQQGY